MMTNQPTTHKRCPQCGAVAVMSAPACASCGRQFRTTAPQNAPVTPAPPASPPPGRLQPQQAQGAVYGAPQPQYGYTAGAMVQPKRSPWKAVGIAVGVAALALVALSFVSYSGHEREQLANLKQADDGRAWASTYDGIWAAGDVEADPATGRGRASYAQMIDIANGRAEVYGAATAFSPSKLGGDKLAWKSLPTNPYAKQAAGNFRSRCD